MGLPVSLSPCERLKRELEENLDPRHLVAFEDEDLETLIKIKCFNLHILSVQPAEYLLHAGLSETLINILEANNLIGEVCLRTAARHGGAGGTGTLKCFV